MGLGRKSREEIIQEEYDKLMNEVTDSELPSRMLDYYGMPALSIPPDDLITCSKCGKEYPESEGPDGYCSRSCFERDQI
jgi:hypothetical protein